MIKPVAFKNQGQHLIGILHIPDELKLGDEGRRNIDASRLQRNRAEQMALKHSGGN